MEDFDKWNILKKKLSNKGSIKFHERDIWWASVGRNLGVETMGKNDTFERPVLVYRKFSSNSFLGFPITTTVSTGNYFFGYEKQNKQKVYVMLHQGRIFSSKRLLRRIEKMMPSTFEGVTSSYLNLLTKIERPALADQSRAPNGEDSGSIYDSGILSTISQNQKQKAEKLLAETKIIEILEKFGKVRLGGSFFTNLMSLNNDIDITVVSEDRKGASVGFINYVTQHRLFQKFEYGDIEKFPRKNRPNDFIVVLKLEHKGSIWEVEIWFKSFFDKSVIELEEKLVKLDEEIRKKILTEKFKRDRYSNKHKLPSYEIYKKYIN